MNNLHKKISEIPDSCLVFNLSKTYKNLIRIYDEAMSEAHITPAQFGILVHLCMHQPISSRDLAEHLNSDPSTVSRNMELLYMQDQVCFSPGKDKRRKIYSLSEKGEKTLEEAVMFWEETHSSIVKQLGEEAYASMLEQFKALERVSKR